MVVLAINFGGKMRKIIILLVVLFTAHAKAGQCYNAYKLSQELEKMVEDVYYISEADDTWHGFASWTPIKEVSAAELKRVLNLKDKIEGEPAFFSLSKDHTSAYNFLRWQIESLESDDEYEDTKNAAKMKKLIQAISKKFGKNVRMIEYGQGDGNNFFVGDDMIILIMDDGCVLGLKALRVWT